MCSEGGGGGAGSISSWGAGSISSWTKYTI